MAFVSDENGNNYLVSFPDNIKKYTNREIIPERWINFLYFEFHPY